MSLSKCFKAYDVRAVYPNPLNEQGAWKVGYAAADFLLREAVAGGITGTAAKSIAVGHDMRKSSPSLRDALIRGLRDGGADVVNVGLVDTPFTYFAVNHLQCAGAIMVTASHNPAQYNGFKISKHHAKPVGQDTGLTAIRLVTESLDEATAIKHGGALREVDLWDAYRAHIVQFIDPALMSGAKRLKIVVDASNGMAGTMLPKVFAGVRGLEIERLNFDNSSGEFLHEPNPLVESNLKQLQDTVRATGAQAGFCFDGDADRCAAVDERGVTVGCDILLAWMVQDMLRTKQGASVVYDLRSSRSVSEIIKECGGIPVESRVGHVFMKAKLAESKALIGGELSGHFYFEDMFGADSGARAFVAVLSALCNATKPLSQLLAPCVRYTQSGEINFENNDKLGALAQLKSTFPHAKTYELDGLSIDAGEWWANIRMSNTEPLLRLNLEAKDRATVDRMVAELEPILGHRVAH